MFLFKFWSYLVGYVIISVQGQNLEKLINMAISRGINLWDTSLTRENLLVAKVRISGFMALRHIARKLGCRLKIRGKRGLPFFYAKLGKRKMLTAGALGSIITLYVLSSFIWFVEVKGNDKISLAKIENLARINGLTRGVLKWQVDVDRIEKTLSKQIPQIAWISIEIKGTKAVIKIAEKVYAEKKTIGKQAHIVSAKDGVVQEVLVLTGIATVKDGDTVKKGQMLISGIIEAPQEAEETNNPPLEEQNSKVEPKYLKAEGIVRARVWYRGYGEAPIVKEGFRATGKTASNLSIKIGTKEIILKGPKVQGFKAFNKKEKVKKLPSWRNMTIPVEVITTYYYELAQYRENLGPEGAAKLASDIAKKKIKQQIPVEAKLVDQNVKKVEAGEDNLVRVEVIIETLEEIGVSRAYSKPSY